MTSLETHIFKLQADYACFAAKMAKALCYGGYECQEPMLKLVMLRSIINVIWDWLCGKSCLTEDQICQLTKQARKLLC